MKIVTQKGDGDGYAGPMITDMENKTIFIELIGTYFDPLHYCIYAGRKELDISFDNDDHDDRWEYSHMVFLGLYKKLRKAEEVIYEIANAIENQHEVFYMPEDDSDNDAENTE